MKMKIEMLPSCIIAFVRQTGPYGPANKQAMERLKHWAKRNRLLTESAILFGIPQDDPRTTPPNKCRYDAGIIISEEMMVDDTVMQGELTGGSYAIFIVEHTVEAVQEAWKMIFPTLHAHGYQLEDGPIMERYQGTMLLDNQCELCVPIKRKDC
ncbi:AraC family transcriptional regulator [Paenibacillus daejeonensis]|uniref:AraC family transcriptional regulator n=1 Tax=Paenibacillus daejeonensis TaxID=135193 RepID=UPI0004777F9C|nr:GyrI-like domain-containing protein [Paenibacillus daejeonensis]